MIVKTELQNGQIVVPLPKNFGIKTGTIFEAKINMHGIITLTPTNFVPDTMEELLKDWEGPYHYPKDLKEWDGIKPVGDELW
ncbi:hypothetical protein FEZ51_10240 [Pediococcus stilesii]|uniref:SpoVT-AbrB domain-containing protein n=1 Tax=Pediococcus stilesii TaxID=331679 RepID=A0A5R9BQF1_9LACO|nr:hypothetical protein [Pediococcus stilesii]TLQ02837.1 hypothetical protein FEZ51_10240 [Pediococcus stilesii]